MNAGASPHMVVTAYFDRKRFGVRLDPHIRPVATPSVGTAFRLCYIGAERQH